jgi:hypothetical protein
MYGASSNAAVPEVADVLKLGLIEKQAIRHVHGHRSEAQHALRHCDGLNAPWFLVTAASSAGLEDASFRQAWLGKTRDAAPLSPPAPPLPPAPNDLSRVIPMDHSCHEIR